MVIQNLFQFFKLDKNYCSDIGYSYFTDSDLIDDTTYIYKILFKRKSKVLE